MGAAKWLVVAAVIALVAGSLPSQAREEPQDPAEDSFTFVRKLFDNYWLPQVYGPQPFGPQPFGPQPFQPQPFQPQPQPQPVVVVQVPRKKICFPADATVVLRDGSSKSMSELLVGDSVATVNANGAVVFEPVYFFRHRVRAELSPYVRVRVASLRSNASAVLDVSGPHFVHANAPGVAADWAARKTVRAARIAPGATMWLVAADSASAVEPATVVSVETVYKRGLYNPYTMGGDILVNGVLASAHSDWILDPLVPAKWDHHLPYVYQNLFSPLRALYRVAGPAAMEALHRNAAMAKKGSAAYLLREFIAWQVEHKTEL